MGALIEFSLANHLEVLRHPAGFANVDVLADRDDVAGDVFHRQLRERGPVGVSGGSHELCTPKVESNGEYSIGNCVCANRDDLHAMLPNGGSREHQRTIQVFKRPSGDDDDGQHGTNRVWAGPIGGAAYGIHCNAPVNRSLPGMQRARSRGQSHPAEHRARIVGSVHCKVGTEIFAGRTVILASPELMSPHIFAPPNALTAFVDVWRDAATKVSNGRNSVTPDVDEMIGTRLKR